MWFQKISMQSPRRRTEITPLPSSKNRHFQMRPSAQPFLWKWVLFAWEWKIIYLSKTEHLTSFWYRGRRENSEMAYSQGRGGPNGGNFRGDGRGMAFWGLFSGESYYSSLVTHPLIISVERPLQGKIEFITPCINMNKKLFSHFTSETITFRITA